MTNFFDVYRQNYYVQKYIQLLHDKYRIVQRIITTDYFLFDVSSSTLQVELLQGGSYQEIGPYSPIKYICVKGWPLSLFSNYTISSVGTEFGIVNETELECLFTYYEGCFKPSLQDLVVIMFGVESQEHKYYLPVFRVANIEVMSLYKSSFYKLKLVTSGKRYHDLRNYWNQVVQTYIFDEMSKKILPPDSYRLINEIRLRKRNYVDELSVEKTIGNYISSLGVTGL